jgi:serine/threonine protein kinase
MTFGLRLRSSPTNTNTTVVNSHNRPVSLRRRSSATTDYEIMETTTTLMDDKVVVLPPPLSLPALAFQEIILGDIIGRGGFSFVYEIKYIKLQEVYDTDDDVALSRAQFASTFVGENNNNSTMSLSSSPPSSSSTSIDDNSSSQGGGNSGVALPCGIPPAQRYVLKTLRPDLPDDEHNKGVLDLAVESQFLSTLSHPNILTLRGHANSDPLESRYFVILDRLVSTLDHKLKVWRRDVGSSSGYWFGPCIGYCCSKSHVLRRIWIERFQVACDIANALDYLHTKEIVYRDLKPDNVGFDADGKLKMFDFGLAKCITSSEDNCPNEDGLYNLTGNTGSLRYMAPEVALNKPYSLSVDVYSFGILFWQLCALSVPYSGFSCKMHSDMVVGKGYRPRHDTTWPESWRTLMSQCWSANHTCRPKFENIKIAMNAELDDWAASVVDDCDFMTTTNEGNDVNEMKNVENIRARKSVFKIRARKDGGSQLDIDTRLAKPEVGVTERKHDNNIV